MQGAYDFMMQLARDAGDVMVDMFHKGESVADWKDSNDTPLTVADTKINRMVIDAIRIKYPHHGIIGEEESDEKEHEYTWICDPIDGTLYFSHHIPMCTFILALVHNGKPVMGVMHNPFMNDTISAHDGTAFHNDTPLKPLDPSAKSKWIDLEYIRASKFDITQLREAVLDAGYMCTTVLSGGSYMSSIAKGGLGALVYTSEGRWDIAAIDAILPCIGGTVTDLSGEPLDYSKPLNGAVVAAPGTSAEILAMTKKYVTIRNT